MPIENGVALRIYSLSGLGDDSGRGRTTEDKTISVSEIASTVVLLSNTLRVWALLVNTGATDVFLRLGAPAALHTGIPLVAAGGWCLINKDMPWTGGVEAIAETAASVVTVVEVSLSGTTPEPISAAAGTSPAGGANGVPSKGRCW